MSTKDVPLVFLLKETIQQRRARNMERKSPGWEGKLWSYLSRGDGIQCPIYQSCQLRLKKIWCFSDHEDSCKARDEFLDDDDPDLAELADFEFKFPTCLSSGEIFKLITRLANEYRSEAGIDRPPIPANLITQANGNLPIEVRQVPLKVYHGAVWRLSDCWLIQLNSNDTRARQRFTLYHEIFHILAHCKATPVFRKLSRSQEGYFNELLADHFSTVILLPREWVTEIWLNVKDINQMTAIFDVPKSVMYLGLRGMLLI